MGPDGCDAIGGQFTCEPVRAPVFAADAVMEEEEAIRIVFVLDRAKPRVVLAPEGVLPVRLEEIGFPDVGADAGQELADFVHRFVHGLSLALRDRRVRLMAGYAGIGGLSERAADRQREGVDDRWVHRRILRRGDRLRRRARKALVDMQRHAMLSGGDERVDEVFALVRREEGRGQPSGLVGVPDGARFLQVSRPEYILRRRALAIVGEDESRERLEHRRVPEILGRQRADPRRRHEGEILRRSGDPIEKRTPDIRGLLAR